MLGVYVVLGVGMVLAFLALIAEVLWKRRKAKQGLIRFVSLSIKERYKIPANKIWWKVQKMLRYIFGMDLGFIFSNFPL